MKRSILISTTVVFLLVATGVSASDEIKSHPGYFPLEELGLMNAQDAEVDINLRGSMLKMISGATSDSDPEFASMAADLKLIRVLVGKADNVDMNELMHRMDEASKRLEAAGWYRMVRVREDDERINIYAKEAGDLIDGLTVLVADGLEEVVLINIVGTMDPAKMGELMEGIDDIGDVDLDLGID